eukprot:CAMPEP_0172800526 /NCGR_PEP_ID=MMETSP1075-20121228/2651_1 /TAXON_ID=2916 /ORGANISM="Ceratium fusus, Strain PA161109" /LENGTH=48 /DNA_ID= /DNA_START= /DNA_END= /DNA_ORIENTATION=
MADGAQLSAALAEVEHRLRGLGSPCDKYLTLQRAGLAAAFGVVPPVGA